MSEDIVKSVEKAAEAWKAREWETRRIALRSGEVALLEFADHRLNKILVYRKDGTLVTSLSSNDLLNLLREAIR